jgi:hypothetical protein
MIVELLIFQMTLDGIVAKAMKEIDRYRQAESISASKARMAMLIDEHNLAGRTSDQLNEISSSTGSEPFKPDKMRTKKTLRRVRPAGRSNHRTRRAR